MVQDDTYYLIKACAKDKNESLAGIVRDAIKFWIETQKVQGTNLGTNKDLLELYNKTFVEKSETGLGLKKIINFVNNCKIYNDDEFIKMLGEMVSEDRKAAGQEFKEKVNNFIASL